MSCQFLKSIEMLFLLKLKQLTILPLIGTTLIVQEVQATSRLAANITYFKASESTCCGSKLFLDWKFLYQFKIILNSSFSDSLITIIWSKENKKSNWGRIYKAFYFKMNPKSLLLNNRFYFPRKHRTHLIVGGLHEIQPLVCKIWNQKQFQTTKYTLANLFWITF